MPEVRIDGKRIWVGDESRALLSGELHYWRLAPERWPAILDRVRELELDVISTYICWDYHEVAPGELDFRGATAPQRNLVRFLDLVAEYGFWLLFRPGPYIYAEWANMGVPDRVAHYHRLHPEFLREAEGYMQAVVNVARPYLATNGGPIVLWQADNEPDSWPRFYAEQLGLGSKPGPFQAYLVDLYAEDIDALNAAWDSTLDDFQQARAVTLPAIPDRGYLNRYLDYRRFQYWYNSQIGRWAADIYRDLGVDVPLYLNFYPTHGIQNWRELEASGQMAGVDFYSTNEFRRDNWEHREFLHLLRYMRTYSALPSIPEFQAGIWHGWHYHTGVLSTRHYELSGLSALLAGVAGWNWYMLVNRDNWYMSPINEWGRTRLELFDVFQRLVTLYRAIDPPSLRKITSTSVVLDILDRSSEIGGFSDPITDALYAADVDYECYDSATGQIARPLMFYSGGRWLSAAAQTRLLDYVEGGGHLVFFQALPVQDEHLNPLNMLGLPAPVGVLDGGPFELCWGSERVNVQSDNLFTFSGHAEEAMPVIAQRLRATTQYLSEEDVHYGLPVGATYTAGYYKRRGRGTITVLGITASPEIVLAIHRWLNVPLASRASIRNMSTALFAHEDSRYILIAVNNSDRDQDTRVTLDAGIFEGGTYRIDDLYRGTGQQYVLDQPPAIPVHIPAKSGAVLRIQRSE